jgi:nucleoid DNA-binding protein
MDIANYIGLFLLKNHFCYVHGLGNMELKKRSATFDGKALQSPSYEVIVTMGGSIDDNLANFIATNEQISISKAANALRDFSVQSRKDMAAGKEVPIPNIGKFSEQDGKVMFVTDANFQYTPAGIPTIRNSKQLDEQQAKIANKPAYPTPHKADSLNWSMIILVAVLLIIVGGGAYGIYYYTSHKSTTAAVSTKDTVVTTQQMPAPVADTMHRDTTSVQAAPSTATGPVDTITVNSYKMIIGSYPTSERAGHRVRTLTNNGDHVDMVKKDSANYLVITIVNCRSVDTLHAEDSLQRLFGYKEVMILK